MKERVQLVGGLCLATICLMATPAQAQETQRYEITEQDLATALKRFAAISGREIVAASAIVSRKRNSPVNGLFPPEQALALVLAQTGLRAEVVDGAFIIRPIDAADGNTSADGSSATDIVVTGTRIRNAPIASPVIKLDQRTIRDQGQSTLAEAAKTIPQNFGGGQNPGVGNNVPAGSGVNVGSASSINLRGLGSDATLTLINGHRLSYSASRQAVDISTVPLGAVDRIEIVPDGASALYGSDAVAGVANIILKRDFDGVETSIRLGTATDGGDFEQRYGLTGGSRWSGGGFVANYEFGRTSAIYGRDRFYALNRPALTLMPLIRNHSATLSGHQDLLPRLTFSVDALYNNRFSATSYSLDPAGNVETNGANLAFTSRSFVVAPTLEFAPGATWRLFLTGSYGQDHTRFDVVSYSAGAATRRLGNCYCNNAKAVEAGGDGTLFSTPAGAIKLAVGAGYRTNHFVRFDGVGATTNIAQDQDSYYGYGELSLPLIGLGQRVPIIDRLSLSAALRYERYPGVGSIATPKFGLIWDPTPDFSLKGSWGNSTCPRVGASLRSPAAFGTRRRLIAAVRLARLIGRGCLRPASRSSPNRYFSPGRRQWSRWCRSLCAR